MDIGGFNQSEAQIFLQGLIQAVFDISVPILGRIIWVCPDSILDETKLN